MLHFLVVDDDVVVGQTFTRMLELDGHRVTAVLSAEAGLAVAAQERPDAVILDMRMPIFTGLDFLRRLRQDVRLREMPVALVTGDYFLNEQLLGEIYSLGATVRYKPLWLEDLSALAKSLVAPRSDA